MSKEYIERWAVVDMLTAIENEFQQYKPFHGFEHAMYRKVCETEIAIGKMPAADVVEVKHGEWVDIGHKIRCSVCDHGVFLGTTDPVVHNAEKDNFNYCPGCGARMDGGADNG